MRSPVNPKDAPRGRLIASNGFESVVRGAMTISTTRPHSDALLAEMMLLHPKLIDLSLGRVERLLAKLGHPEQRLPAHRPHRRD